MQLCKLNCTPVKHGCKLHTYEMNFKLKLKYGTSIYVYFLAYSKSYFEKSYGISTSHVHIYMDPKFSSHSARHSLADHPILTGRARSHNLLSHSGGSRPIKTTEGCQAPSDTITFQIKRGERKTGFVGLVCYFKVGSVIIIFNYKVS